MKKQLNMVALGVAGMAAAAGANAAPITIDLSSMSGSVDSSTVITAIVAFGIIKLGPGFAQWATNRIAGFFGRA